MVERVNAPGLAKPPGYHHLAIVSDVRLIFLAGQVPLDDRGNLVGRDDPVEQGKQCLRNLAVYLGAAGARLEAITSRLPTLFGVTAFG